jgi:hypothetical protein
VVLFDLGVLVVDVHARGDPGGDHPGAEPARGDPWAGASQPAVEDEADLVGAPGVEVVAMTWSTNTRPDTGRSSTWVRQNSTCRIEMSYR